LQEKKVAIIGVGVSEIGKHTEKTVNDLAIDVVSKALKDAKIKKEDLDGIFMTPEGFSVRSTKMKPQRICEYFNITPKSTGIIECGGVSSMLATKFAINEILLGNNKINLVFSSEIERYRMKEADEIEHLLVEVNALYSPYDSSYGMLAATPYYAMAIQRYMYENNIKPEEIAILAVILRENASKNPVAQFKDKITVSDVLNSRIVTPPIHLLESCPMSDGASAIVLAQEDIAREICDKPVFITGIGEYHDSSHFTTNYKDITDYVPVREATNMALSSAKRKLSDIDVAEVYGAFAGSELMCYEAMGFFEKGKAPKAVFDGLTKIDGKIPINTSGGRLSLGHPPYVTPLLEIIEIALQLKGEAGERQVKDAKIGLAHSEHGVMNGSIVMILEREE
jgi:acetyl-CoA C-acetyltransferase